MNREMIKQVIPVMLLCGLANYGFQFFSATPNYDLAGDRTAWEMMGITIYIAWLCLAKN